MAVAPPQKTEYNCTVSAGSPCGFFLVLSTPTILRPRLEIPSVEIASHLFFVVYSLLTSILLYASRQFLAQRCAYSSLFRKFLNSYARLLTTITGSSNVVNCDLKKLSEEHIHYDLSGHPVVVDENGPYYYLGHLFFTHSFTVSSPDVCGMAFQQRWIS